MRDGATMTLGFERDAIAPFSPSTCSAAGRLVGLGTTLHVFKSKRRHDAAKARLSKRGTITEIFVDNRHAFELKLWRKMT